MSCRAALNAARSLGDEPIFISQLTRLIGVVHTCQAIERTLAQGEPPPEDIAALQKLLKDEDAFPSLFISMRGQRAFLHKVFEGVENGKVPVNDLSQFRPNSAEGYLTSLGRIYTRQYHAHALALASRRLREARQPMHEQAVLEEKFDREIRELSKTDAVGRSLLPAMSIIGWRFRRRHAYLRCAIVALAAERCRQEKKACPDSVKQLCPEYLADVPLDPFDGKPLRYRRVKDGVIIYSVGPDAIDNIGNLSREHPSGPAGTDIGFRLWDVTKRRQPSRANPPKP